MKIITKDAAGEPIIQGTDAWKQLRVGMLTASVMSDILPGKRGGYLASRKTALMNTVWERLNGTPKSAKPGLAGNSYIRDGVEREPFARLALQGCFGYVVEETAFIQHDWMQVGVSLDGWVPSLKRTIEIKCPADTTHMDYFMLDEAPEEYYTQIQTQLWIAECDSCDFVSYHPGAEPSGMDLHVIRVPRDDAYIAMLEKEANTFLAEVNYLVNKYNERRIVNDAKLEQLIKEWLL